MTPERRRPASQLEPLRDTAGAREVVGAGLRARRAGEVVGVLILQLDRADLLADAYGQDLVDNLLTELADRLRPTVRTDDRLLPAGRASLCLVARSMPGQRDVALLAERVVRATRRPLALPDGVEHEVTVSVGASVGRDRDTAAGLLARAERRCRAVAAAGGGRWSVEPIDADIGAGAPPTGDREAGDSDRAVRRDAVARLRQAGELRQALAAGHLDLALTPLAPLLPGLGAPAAGGDALHERTVTWRVVAVRWRHPVRGLLHPAAVVSAVVDAGLAGAYLETGLRLAASEAVDASVGAGRPVGVAVDLALAVAVQARAQGVDLTELVAGAVARARLDPAQLALRVSVDDARAGAHVLAPVLERLAGLGTTSMLTGVDPSPASLAWLDSWPHASVWILDRAVTAALAVPPVDARSGARPAGAESEPGTVLARAGAAAVVAAANARGLAVGADGVDGVDDPARVAAELAAAGVVLVEGRWAARSASAAA